MIMHFKKNNRNQTSFF